MKTSVTSLLRSRTGWLAMLVLSLSVLPGCASGPNANPRDPLEPFNRGVYQFNDALDRAVLKPVATGYREVVPSPVRRGVSNFFANLQDAWSFVNHVLQLNGEAAGNSLARFGVNTTLGFAGLLDIASEMQIERQTRDFGHTLGYWGVGPGPYLVLPLMGPSTVRDTVALPVDVNASHTALSDHVPTRNSVTTVKLVNQRAVLLDATDMLEQAALDPYTFVRDAYLQRRRNQIYNGNPPDEEEPLPAADENTPPDLE